MMKRWISMVVAGVLWSPAWVLSAEEKAAGEPPASKPAATQPGGDAFKNDDERVGYSVGLSQGLRWAAGMKQQEVVMDIDMLLRGMKDGLTGGKGLLTEQEAQQVLMEWQGRMRAELPKKQAERAAKNKADGEKFLEENKKKEGVKTTASGLQYKVLKSGDGPSPKAGDNVSVHYKGTLIDGTQFDSSYDRGQPQEFGVTEVIKGWTEGLEMMKVGDKWQLYIPSDAAYGANGRRPHIPPNAALIFEVELLGIKPGAATTAPATGAMNPQLNSARPRLGGGAAAPTTRPMQ